MASMDIKLDVNVGNIGKIYRNDQGVLEKKMLAMDVGSIPEFDPENEYKECEMIEKFRKDLGIRKATEEYAINEITKRYDDMMCRRYFNMSAVDFRILIDRVVRLGGKVDIMDSMDSMWAHQMHEGPIVNIQIPCDKLDRLKIENELVYQHMLTPIIPAVDKIVTHNDRVTIVYFVDGTFTKCVCGKDEEFNLYTGVAFCLFKKMLSHMGDDGHKKFNTMMRKAMKTIEDEEKLQKMISQAKHEEKLREAKRLEKKRRKELKKKEGQIHIMQEALRRDREAANKEE